MLDLRQLGVGHDRQAGQCDRGRVAVVQAALRAVAAARVGAAVGAQAGLLGEGAQGGPRGGLGGEVAAAGRRVPEEGGEVESRGEGEFAKAGDFAQKGVRRVRVGEAGRGDREARARLAGARAEAGETR